MFTIRSARDRGHTRFDWLESWHTFSFGDYFDPQFNQFGSLRVINDDRVAGGGGFGTHPHRDMEILTYIVTGAIEHQDSLGHRETIPAGSWQYMSAGRGILHSEYNPSPSEEAHFLQIWILPEARGLPPRYQQKSVRSAPAGEWITVASREGEADAIAIRQDARVMTAKLNPGQSIRAELSPERRAWLHIVRGTLRGFGQQLAGGDGVGIHQETAFELHAEAESEVILFDLA